MDKSRLLLFELGKRIRSLRMAQKLSQEELSYRADLHRMYVGMLERGEKNFTISNLAKISGYSGDTDPHSGKLTPQ
ncbi:MAG: helix-turn-helix transcriptional regulator [Bacteroidetes bacterium]|nr:helix-turn-helix transcriptional regulator [Bacteroidota bacterium]